MKNQINQKLWALLGSVVLASLAACGVGGGGGTTAVTSSYSANCSNGTIQTSTVSQSAAQAACPASTTVPAGTTVATSQYTSTSVQSAMFAQINSLRATCGFPAVQENTLLDQAAQNHAQYMIANGGLITDTETQGNPGFTGVTGQDRADALGWPSSVYAGAGDVGYYTNATLSNTQYGQNLVAAWATGVYHQTMIAFPGKLFGLGVAQTTYAGFPQLAAGGMIGQLNTTPGTLHTFPCAGVTGLPYAMLGEVPQPPNVVGTMFGSPAWGTAQSVWSDNANDVVLITSASMIPAGGSTSVALNILTSLNDSNHLVWQSYSTAYPTSPLTPNTTYNVTLTGTLNGAPFNLNYSWTSGSTVG